MATLFNTSGRYMFIADASINIGQAAYDVKEGNYSAAGKAGLDTAMSAIGVFGKLPVLAISTTYPVVDKFIGWNNVGTAINIMYEENQQWLNWNLKNMGM